MLVVARHKTAAYNAWIYHCLLLDRARAAIKRMGNIKLAKGYSKWLSVCTVSTHDDAMHDKYITWLRLNLVRDLHLGLARLSCLCFQMMDPTRGSGGSRESEGEGSKVDDRGN